MKLAAALVAAAVSTGAAADDKLWALLANGGQVVLIRHTITTPGVGDPPGMRLDDCSTQRNLTDAGRRHARRIGEAFRARRVPVGRVVSSPWCRCLETARLAFDKEAEVSGALGNLFGRPENREAQVREMRAMVETKPAANLVLVTHGSTIAALTGVSPATGEMVVLSQGRLAGRLAVPD